MRIGILGVVLLVSALLLLTQGTFSKEPLERPLFGPGVEQERSHQVLHRHSQNKHYHMSPDAHAFVENHFRHAIPVLSDSEVVRIASDYVSMDGEYLVFGVGCGKALNFIAALNPTATIYGFDAFKTKKPITPFLHNVKIVEGQFKDTLPTFSEDHLPRREVAFLLINCHNYRSTRDVFLWLKDHLADRSVIVFDEFYNFPSFENEEYLAFQEFLDENQFEAEYLCFNTVNEQVAVRLKKRW